MRTLILALTLLALCLPAIAADPLQQAIAGSHRTGEYVLRDQYRHPYQTLRLFDVQPQHTVVEVWPGGGWYTEILAPYLRDAGLLIAAHYDESDEQASYRPGSRRRFDEKMAGNAAVYGKVRITSLMFDEEAGRLVKGAAGADSVDRVVTFRNAHGLVARGTLRAALAHFFQILKPGGKLGVVQHLADPGQDFLSRNIGYVGRDYLVAEAVGAGFVLQAEGFFNRNPLDNKRYEEGVWQLPPTLRGLESDAEKAPYLAIGESERMTLVFVKP